MAVQGCHRDLGIDAHRWACATTADCSPSFECDPTTRTCVSSSTVAPDAGVLQDAGYTAIVVTDEAGMHFAVIQGPPGPPSAVGCADGRREGLVDMSRYPTIAGCIGSWTSSVSMRDPPTGKACGNDLAPCAVPADLCASGWNVCSSTGAVSDLTRRLTGAECESAGAYRYEAAISHCNSQQANQCPSPGADYPCWTARWCAEPVCCGAACNHNNVCKSGVWPNRTFVAFLHRGCATIPAQIAGGVLCCLNR
jgi:hypothetical protein